MVTKLKKSVSLITVLCVMLIMVSIPKAVSADAPFYKMTVTTDATGDYSVGDIVVAKVTLNTTEGLSGYQFVLKYDPEAFEIDTYRNGYVNSDWKKEFALHNEWSIPTQYTLITNETDGRISNVSTSTYGNGEISAEDALTNVAILGVNLKVKNVELAKGSTIEILQDENLVMATTFAGEEKPEVVNAVIPSEPLPVTVNLTETNVVTTGIAKPSVVVLSSYNGTRLIDVQYVETSEDIDIAITSTGLDTTDATSVTAMILEDLTNIRPLCANSVK